MKKFYKKLRKILVIYLVGMLFIIGNARYTYGFPTPPEAPTAPEAPAAPSAPSAPETPVAPEAPVAPSAPSAPETPGSPSDPVEPVEDTQELNDQTSADDSSFGSTGSEVETGPQTVNSDSESTDSGTSVVGSSGPVIESTGGEESNEGMGSALIATGNADNTGAIVNTGANNMLSVGENGFEGGIIITSVGNGPDSVNTGSAVITDNSTSSQVNTTTVVNNLNQLADSGHNEASKNMAGAEITTGDANTTGTIINAVNTNVDGIMVSEFNIVDDHVGDIVLDFAQGCVSNCGEGDIQVVNSGNGPDSTNTGNLDLTTNDISFQPNDANVENNMTLAANSGDNTANKNMNGETAISTGDANVSANIVNFVNNNLAGNVVYAVVNILGDLIGDIIMPESMLTACCGNPDVTAANTGNGPDSTNTANVALTDTDLVSQFNNANIDNNLIYDANTGGNGLSKDMGGDTTVKTGDAEILAQVLNIANTNVITGNSWLVIVNEAGKWIGKILGTDGNTSLAGSEGFEFVVNDAGDILAVNSGNGPDSTNTTNINVNNTDVITQVNNANVVNNVNLSANTGGNETDKNMGGSSIVTGDAKIVANIVNFVNNNIVGQGKLFVTVVNVFGSWMGDFITPGHEHDKDVAEDPGTGGTGDLPPATDPVSSSNSNSGSGGSSSGSSSSSSSNSGSSAVVSGVLPFGSKVLGARFFKTSSEEENSVEFNSISNDAQVITDAMGKKVVKINMAYGIFILPLIFGGLLVRRKLHFRHASVK